MGGKKKAPIQKKNVGAEKKNVGVIVGGEKVDANRPHLFFENCGRFLIFFNQSLGTGLGTGEWGLGGRGAGVGCWGM